MGSPSSAPVVISIGGSVIWTGEDDAHYLGGLATLLRRAGKRRPIGVTTGGGSTARQYIELGRKLGLTEVELDEIGIDVTRLHARLLAGRIGPPTPAHPPTTVAAAVHEIQRGPLVVMGGTEPGHTTDGVAALLAVRLRAARIINATSVDGIYDRDPRTHPAAKRIERLSWERFREMVHAGASSAAGQQFPFDHLAVNVLARAKIPLAIVQGRDLVNLERAIEGRTFDGSRVEGSVRPQRV